MIIYLFLHKCYLIDFVFVFFFVFMKNQYMNAFDRAMNLLDEKFSFLSSTKQVVSSASDEDKVIVAWIRSMAITTLN